LLESDVSIASAQAMLDVAPYAFPTPLETGFEQGLPAFLSGKAAMIEFWTDLGVNAQDPKVSQIIDKWDVTQMPVGGSNTSTALRLTLASAWRFRPAQKSRRRVGIG
jgi:multiple sugar transport system substrate-binding protein